jgi:hypothetical protein
MADNSTNQNPASAENAHAPTVVACAPVRVTDLLHFSGLPPERWFRLSAAERADWTRRYIEAGVQPDAILREQGRGPGGRRL